MTRMHICRVLCWVQDLLQKMLYASSTAAAYFGCQWHISALERRTYSKATQKQLQRQFGWNLTGHEKVTATCDGVQQQHWCSTMSSSMLRMSCTWHFIIKDEPHLMPARKTGTRTHPAEPPGERCRGRATRQNPADAGAQQGLWHDACCAAACPQVQPS
jgi:hypothetical protein